MARMPNTDTKEATPTLTHEPSFHGHLYHNITANAASENRKAHGRMPLLSSVSTVHATATNPTAAETVLVGSWSRHSLHNILLARIAASPSSAQLGEAPIEFTPVAERDQYGYVTLDGYAQTIVSYPDAVVASTC